MNLYPAMGSHRGRPAPVRRNSQPGTDIVDQNEQNPPFLFWSFLLKPHHPLLVDFFLKKRLTHVLFWYPLFWISGDNSSGFQRQPL